MGETSINQKLDKVGLPNVVFMFTIDQIAAMLNTSLDQVSNSYLFYQGRSTGIPKRSHMTAINIAPEDMKAEWRVSLEAFRSWLSRMGFRSKDFTRM